MSTAMIVSGFIPDIQFTVVLIGIARQIFCVFRVARRQENGSVNSVIRVGRLTPE